MARIVVADNQSHIRGLLSTWLAQSGHQVIEAESAHAALRALREQSVDVLISDVATPTMDRIALVENAFTVCDTLRRAFVLTASCDPHDLMQRVSDPRVSVHARPFSPSQLLRDLDDALRRAGLKGATDAISPTTEVIWTADSDPPPNAPGGEA